jgi:hypothetical protein
MGESLLGSRVETAGGHLVSRPAIVLVPLLRNRSFSAPTDEPDKKRAKKRPAVAFPSSGLHESGMSPQVKNHAGLD